MCETPDRETLAQMRRQYPLAGLETHMLGEDGLVYLRCARCGVRPVPHCYLFAELCDECLAGLLAELNARLQ